MSSAVNLLSVIFAKVYFPTFSNGIKEIARYLGFEWENPAGSGLQSIIWRSQWEASGEKAVKRSLLIYNANDCEAVEVVAKRLLQLQQFSENPDQSPEVVFTASLKWKHPIWFQPQQVCSSGPRYHQQGSLLGLSTGESLCKVEWMRQEGF